MCFFFFFWGGQIETAAIDLSWTRRRFFRSVGYFAMKFRLKKNFKHRHANKYKIVELRV